MKKKICVIHAIAVCQNCGKEFDNYKNAQALAAQHAKKYKHCVTGEVAMAFEYEGRV